MSKNFLDFFIHFFFLTFLITDTTLPITIFSLKIFVIDFVFLLLLTTIVIIKKNDLIKFSINYKNFSFVEIISGLLLLIFILKFLFNLNNFQNFYQFFSFVYILVIFFTFKYLLYNYLNFEKKIINNFIYIFFISILIIFLTTTLYYLNVKINGISLWEKAEHYPYFNKSIVHVHGFIKNYNMFAYVMIPGFIFFIFENYINKPYIFFVLLLGFTSILAFIVKAKIFILVFLVSLVFFIYNYFKKFSCSKFLLLFSLLILLILYFLSTNFIIFQNTEFNKLIILNNPKYYTFEPLINFYNYSVHGTFFYKLKLVALEQAKTFNYIFFDSLDFLSFFDSFSKTRDFDYSSISNSEPHSHYFSILGDFGLVGLFIILLFSSYPFIILSKKKINNKSMSMIIILVIFLMEGINVDLINFRFFWIILALTSFNFDLKKLVLKNKIQVDPN